MAELALPRGNGCLAAGQLIADLQATGPLEVQIGLHIHATAQQQTQEHHHHGQGRKSHRSLGGTNRRGRWVFGCLLSAPLGPLLHASGHGLAVPQGGQGDRPVPRPFQSRCLQHAEQVLGLGPQVGIAAAQDLAAAGHGPEGVALAHPGGGEQELQFSPLGGGRREGLRLGLQGADHQAVVAAFEGKPGWREGIDRWIGSAQGANRALGLQRALAAHHHRANPRIGEHFQQQGMGDPAIDDVGRCDALGQGPNAAFGFGRHAAIDDPGGD